MVFAQREHHKIRETKAGQPIANFRDLWENRKAWNQWTCVQAHDPQHDASQKGIECSYKNDDLGDPLINFYHAVALKLAAKEEIATIVDLAFRGNVEGAYQKVMRRLLKEQA